MTNNTRDIESDTRILQQLLSRFQHYEAYSKTIIAPLDDDLVAQTRQEFDAQRRLFALAEREALQQLGANNRRLGKISAQNKRVTLKLALHKALKKLQQLQEMLGYVRFFNMAGKSEIRFLLSLSAEEKRSRLQHLQRVNLEKLTNAKAVLGESDRQQTRLQSEFLSNENFIAAHSARQLPHTSYLEAEKNLMEFINSIPPPQGSELLSQPLRASNQ